MYLVWGLLRLTNQTLSSDDLRSKENRFNIDKVEIENATGTYRKIDFNIQVFPNLLKGESASFCLAQRAKYHVPTLSPRCPWTTALGSRLRDGEQDEKATGQCIPKTQERTVLPHRIIDQFSKKNENENLSRRLEREVVKLFSQ